MPPKKSPPKSKPISLNEEQQAVVSAGEGYWQVQAGPGAGKSSCLVQRLARLIRDGVSPDDLLSLTFTNTAAKNLKERVESQVGKFESKIGSGARTFHGLSLSFAQEERHAFNFTLAEFPLATEPITAKYIAQSAARYEVDPRLLRKSISLFKRRRIRPGGVIKTAEAEGKPADIKLALGYKHYDAACRKDGLLDFDSLIFEMVEILESKPEVRQRWVRDWIQLDESQDCSKIEWDLARLLSGKSVLAVGDTSQGIYSFRGSDSRLFAEMDKIFPGTKTLYLACNYRSTPEIIDFIRPIAATKELAERFHTSNASGPTPEIKGFPTGVDEANWVIQRIKDSI